ncbi:MAG: glycosyltransferase family 4 protein [Clostridium sp.]|nr:glycosyltransferase family 4 protein [Clostridium sp.]MBK5241015.1 glycosyltransferase family 4 protein [Clostridium sp.]
MIGHKRIPSREGGIEIVVEELSTRLVAAGNTVHVYNRKGHHVSGSSFDRKSNGNISEYKGIKIITIPTFKNVKLNAFVYSALATFRALFGRYDCVHYHGEGPCAMLWLPHLLGIRTVVTIHGLDWQRAKWGGFATKYLKFGEKIAAKYADEVIVLSKNVQQYFLDTYGREVKFIPNGIEKPEIRETDVISKKWELKKDEYILFLGRIVPEKGLQYLIDAYKRVDTLKKLVVAGGSSHTGDYMVDIKRKSVEDGRVIFTNFVQGEELEELYSNAYLYVLPSDLEGMPISLLEAMSYGNCCLVSDIHECKEVVEDKAVTFKRSDVEDLKVKLEWLIDNADIVGHYKSLASQFVCEKYKWDTVVEMTKKLYQK